MRIIAILSKVPKSIPSAMVSHPIWEHGVVCLSKFRLLADEGKVVEEFRPLHMMIDGSMENCVEVQVQVALTLCDLALIHEMMLLVPTEKKMMALAVMGNGAVGAPRC